MSLQFSPGLGNHGMLPLAVMVVVKIYDDPVTGTIQAMRPGGIRVKCGEVPVLVTGVKNRQPGPVFGIESLRRDQRQLAGRRLAAVLVVYFQDQPQRRFGTVSICWPERPALAVEVGLKPGLDRLAALFPQACNLVEAARVNRVFQRLEAIDMQFVVDALRQSPAERRNRA